MKHIESLEVSFQSLPDDDVAGADEDQTLMKNLDWQPPPAQAASDAAHPTFQRPKSLGEILTTMAVAFSFLKFGFHNY